LFIKSIEVARRFYGLKIKFCGEIVTKKERLELNQWAAIRKNKD